MGLVSRLAAPFLRDCPRPTRAVARKRAGDTGWGGIPIARPDQRAASAVITYELLRRLGHHKEQRRAATSLRASAVHPFKATNIKEGWS